jgi:hypothetical protein
VPPDDARERNRILLARRIALAAAAGAAASSARPAAAALAGAAPGTGAALTGWLGKWMIASIVIAVGGGIGVGAFVATGGSRRAPANQPAASAPALPHEPLASAKALEPQPGDAPPDTQSPSAQAPPAGAEPRARQEPSAAPDALSLKARNLERELQLLRSAQRALEAGSPALALTLVDRHAAEFSRGILNQECEVVRILALCASGRVASSREARDRFLKQHPSSPLAERVRTTCGGGR